MKLENWTKWDGETRPFTTSDPQQPPSVDVHSNAIYYNKEAIDIAWCEAGFDQTREALCMAGDQSLLLQAIVYPISVGVDMVELPWRLAQIGKDALDIALHGIAMGWKKLF